MAMAPRIPMITGEGSDLSPEQKRVADETKSGPRGHVPAPLLALLHRPDIADPLQKLGGVLRYATGLGPRLSELAILVTARAWDCEQEWSFHVPPAREAGLEEEIIAAISAGKRPNLTNADDIAVYDYVDQMQTHHRIEDATYAAVLNRWGVSGPVALSALSGYYSMIAQTLLAHGVPVPPGKVIPLPAIKR